jgi:hypothetical protein
MRQTKHGNIVFHGTLHRRRTTAVKPPLGRRFCCKSLALIVSEVGCGWFNRLERIIPRNALAATMEYLSI